jgi:hypothetical protein
MSLAVIAGTGGDLGLLERTLERLSTAHGVRRVVPVGDAVADARALLQDRARRFPEERAWTDAGYADFVLHAILEGIAEVPTPEAQGAKSRRLRALLGEVEGEGEPPPRIQIGDRAVAFVAGGAAPPTDVALWVSAVSGPPAVARPAGEVPCLRPGRLGTGRSPGEPAACALLTAEPNALVVTFVDPDGAVLGIERI